MLKIKNVILEISFRNDILLCNIKKGCLAILVHVFVVVLVFTGDDGFPPFFVIQIPLNGFFDTVCEFGFRQPAQFVVDLGRVDGIALVVSESVLDKSNQ